MSVQHRAGPDPYLSTFGAYVVILQAEIRSEMLHLAALTETSKARLTGILVSYFVERKRTYSKPEGVHLLRVAFSSWETP